MLYDRPEKNSRQFNRGIDYATVLYSFAALTHFMSETLESCLTIEQSLYKRIENRKKRKETIFLPILQLLSYLSSLLHSLPKSRVVDLIPADSEGSCTLPVEAGLGQSGD